MNERVKNRVAVCGLVILGILVNMGFNRLASVLGTPFYLDTIGTVVSASLGGYVPGIIVALSTNLIASLQDSYNAYFSILNVLIAICTTYCYRAGYFKRIGKLILFILLISTIGGVYGFFITWTVSGPDESGIVHDISVFLDTHMHLGVFLSNTICAFLLDIADKIISVPISILIIRLIPEKTRNFLDLTNWMQTPVKREDLDTIEETNVRNISIRNKVVILIAAACISIAVIIGTIALRLFKDYTEDQHIKMADSVAKASANVIDAKRVDEFMEKGHGAEGYDETEAELYGIKAVANEVEYLYVYKIEKDGCHVVFDLDTEEVEASEPGEIIEFDESFEPYLDELLAGERIDPIISDDKFGWLMTVYEPVYDGDKCVCYVGIDIPMTDINVYGKNFMLKLCSLGFGFFLLILNFSLWLAKYHLILPINAMSNQAGKFAYTSEAERDKNVSKLKELNIGTGDELEILYHTYVKTTEDAQRYYEDMQTKSEALTKLQNGLLVVLADIVENRDESTGNHIKKTAAYAEIILRALRAKGYYADQITDEYISDVVNSAPLHDIGKISIPDAILNKPGKLTDDEFEIMKTHTTAGEEIIEKAMATLNNADYLGEARNLAGYHHEKWNGKGYPRGLSGEDIPLSARVMAVADVFDALVSKRIYKPAFTFEKAMDIIKEDAGTHFDPRVAEVFMESVDEVKRVQEKFDKEYEEIRAALDDGVYGAK
ncbi:MAG: HD domain-containing protein [Lachnospiraceae bacterium]|nr:HD domain-containing protein [Lachnospiraceae bacterium]